MLLPVWCSSDEVLHRGLRTHPADRSWFRHLPEGLRSVLLYMVLLFLWNMRLLLLWTLWNVWSAELLLQSFSFLLRSSPDLLLSAVFHCPHHSRIRLLRKVRSQVLHPGTVSWSPVPWCEKWCDGMPMHHLRSQKSECLNCSPYLQQYADRLIRRLLHRHMPLLPDLRWYLLRYPVHSLPDHILLLIRLLM